MAEAATDLGGKTLYVTSRSTTFLGRRCVIKFLENGVFSMLVDFKLLDEWNKHGTYSIPLTGQYSYLGSTSDASSIQISLQSTSSGFEQWNLNFSSADRGKLVQQVQSTYFFGDFVLAPAVSAHEGIVNVSAMMTAKQGSPVTVGFVVGGDRMREFLLRVVGPSLSHFGVKAFAADPHYRLGSLSYNPPGQIGLSWSSDAGSTATITNEGIRCGAFPLISGSSDKADIVLLNPGPQTITVEANSPESEGDVLIEVYEVPGE